MRDNTGSEAGGHAKISWNSMTVSTGLGKRDGLLNCQKAFDAVPYKRLIKQLELLACITRTGNVCGYSFKRMKITKVEESKGRQRCLIK